MKRIQGIYKATPSHKHTTFFYTLCECVCAPHVHIENIVNAIHMTAFFRISLHSFYMLILFTQTDCADEELKMKKKKHLSTRSMNKMREYNAKKCEVNRET